jgi:acetyl esterase/lipase
MTEDLSVLDRAAPAPDDVVRYGDDTDQAADVRFGDQRARQRPLVLLIHGGFWRPQYDRAQTGPMAAALAAMGWTVAAIGYRRIPGVPDATVADVALALGSLPSKVAQHDGRVILIGHSAGGHLALLVATKHATPSLSGVLALAPAADLQLAEERALGNGAVSAFLGTTSNARADLDPQRLAAPSVATTVVHGDDDAVVPLAISGSYHATHASIRLVRLEACGHFALIDPLSPAWPAVVRELERLSDGGRVTIAPPTVVHSSFE